MKNTNKMTPRSILLLLALVMLMGLLVAGCSDQVTVQEIPAEDSYTYINPDETQAEPDAGFTIDGVLDEEAYQNSNWLYLSNKEGGSDVEIAMTSYFGEKGMYFVYDVTEGNPIYVNLNRPPYMNSCVEMYLAPNTVHNMKGNSVFEIDLLPSGDMTFKKSNGKGQFVDVATTKDMMAVLGATTKGGDLNTDSCYGYCLELFIPWEYMDKFDLDSASMKESYVYVDPAHITSFNYAGTNMDVDRYWYFFAQEHGASWNNVYQYFRFDGKGVQGTVPVELEAGAHYTMEGVTGVIPGMQMNVTVTPDAGYALSSILINGEEHIQEANFNEDGSVTIRQRATAGGVKISAKAEAVSEGNKTLTGTVIANKLGGGSLENITASYKGPTGEKPLELGKDGSFVLTDLKQGLYTILLEKDGYQKLSRSIYVNRDMEIVLKLEYDLFEASAYGWVLDDQNTGILHKFGGDGQLLTKELYDQFTASATFRFDEELTKEGDFDSFLEQRKGFQIKFDNGKTWHVDLLKQNGKFYVQYAKHSGNDSLTGWSKVYELTEDEVKAYTGEGIELSIKRAGKYANVYLNGKMVSQEIFANEYATRKAQVGFEAWTANREIMEVPFHIEPKVNVALYHTFFRMKNGWDVSQQYNGVITKVGGGTGRLSFIEKYKNLDLTLTVRDYPNSKDPEGVAPRTDVLFTFENGKQMSFSVDAAGTKVQSMYDSSAADKYINTGWQTWGTLTDAEIAQLRADGVDFRVVRYGTEVTLYLGDRMVAVADLTANGSGVTADMKANVHIRHYDDTGVQVNIPFQVKQNFDLVKVTAGTGLTTEKQQYLVGDTVKVTAKDDANYIASLKVNGKDVTVNFDGTYSFVATEAEYTITGTVAKSIFKPDSQWNLMEQNNGILSIPARTGSYASLYTTDKTYRDAAITVSDLNPKVSGAGDFQAQIRFIFANGKEYQIRLHNTNKADTYEIQSMGGTNCISGWKKHVELTPEQAAKVRSEGVQFRVALVGTNARIYLDGVEMAVYDLSSGGLTADATAQIRYMLYGNQGVENLILPYALGSAPKTATIHLGSVTGGTLTTGKADNIALAGEEITLTATPNPGYNLVALSVTKDGAAVDLGKVALTGGSYSFTAEEGTYTVSAEFAPRTFLNNDLFDLRQQHNGTVTLLAGSTKASTLKTEANTYREVAVTVRDQESGTFKTEFHFTFTNGQKFQIRLDNEAGYYRVQNMGGSDMIVTGWTKVHELNADQIAQLKSVDGLTYRVAIVGTYAFVYLDNVEVGVLDLSAGISNETAQIAVVLYGNNGKQNISIPYTLGMGSAASTIQVAGGITGGNVSTNKTVCVAGETVTITATPNANYNLTGLTVTKDGVAVDIGSISLTGGNYSFVTQEGSYSVSATFAPKIFQDTEYYDLSGQYSGSVVLLEGATGARSLKTVGNTYRDVAVTVRDQEIGTFKTEFHFTFTNGKKFQIRLDNEAGYYRVQNMGGSSMIVTGWTKVHELNADQIAQLKSAAGLTYRVTLLDNFAIVYLGTTEVGRLDLSAGNVAGETAQVNIVLYGNSGKQNITVPFTLGQGPKAATVKVNAPSHGTLTADKAVCVAGETVTLTATPTEDYNLTSLTVTKDGAAVDIGSISLSGGSYSFVTQEGSYSVSATFAPKIFQDTEYYDLSGQYSGSVVLLEGATGARTLKSVGNTYRDVAVTVRDQESGTFKTEFHFTFTNGQKFQIRLDNEAGYYRVQNMGGSSMIVTGWTKVHELNADQIAQLKSAAGLTYRVTIEGAQAVVYLGGTRVGALDLSSKISTETAQISIVLYGNSGKQNITIPYILTSGPAASTLSVVDNANGTVTLDKVVCAAGETVTVTAAPAEGYNMTGLTVKKDGQVVKTFATDFTGGTFTFQTEEGSYTVEGHFAKPVFYIGTGGNDTDDVWSFAQQYSGSVYVTRGGTYCRLYTTERDYRSVSVTVKDLTPTFASDGKGNFKMQVYFDFGSAGQFQIRLHNENTDSKYKVQKMGNTFSSGWSVWYTLTDAEVDQLQNGSGVNFRVALEGSKAVAYINGAKVGEIDLSGKVDASTTAQIILIMYGNNGQAFAIPYTLGK